MTFWILVALLLALVVGVLLWSLLRQRGEIVDEVRENNVQVARQKLKELEADFKAGTLDEQAFQQAREELEQELLEDTRVVEQRASVTAFGRRSGVVFLAVLLPAASLGLYGWLGSPQLSSDRAVAEVEALHARMRAGGEAPTLEEIVQTLEKRVKEKPDDAEAWFMLGRVYSSERRFSEAAKTFEKVAKLTDEHPQALVAWADALAMTQGGRMRGKPYELVKKALEKAPEDSTALWLAGKGASETGDYQNAIYYWRQAEAGLADNPDYVRELRGLIAQAKQAAAAAGLQVEDPGSAVDLEAASSGIRLQVTLSPKLRDKVKPGEPLFIFAKAPSGPPMPVAAVRLTAGQLPAQVELTDGNLIRGGSLKDYKQLKIAARIARSGQPMAASGDFQSAEKLVQVGAGKPVELVIDQVVP